MLEADQTYRRLIEVEGRQSDNGLYVDPSNSLTIFPDSSGLANFVTGQFHYIALTYDDGIATGYFDGDLDFMSPSTVMDLFNPRNPNRLMNFFLDNNSGPAQGEYADGRVALLRMTDGVLSEDEIALRAIDPFAIPEPSAAILLGAAIATSLALICPKLVRRNRHDG